MTLNDMPIQGRLYWWAIVLTGLTTAFAVASLHTWDTSASNLQLLGFLVFAAFAGGKKIGLVKQKATDDSVSMSLGFAITFAALLRFGVIGGVSAGVVAALSGCLFPKRQKPFQLLFNVSLGALEAALGSWVYLTLNGGSLTVSPDRTFFAVCGSTLTFFGVNTGGVATIIALSSRQNLIKLWKDTFLWTAPSYFAGAAVSGLAIVIFGLNLGYMVMFVLPVAYLTYVSYRTYTNRAEERQKHIEELQANQLELADLYLATIKSLALAIDAKDQYTHQHILRVQRYAVAIAQEVGLNGIELEAVNTGALLHDIGKLGVPEYVLLKPGRLTDEEFDKIKKHPEIGAAILDPVSFPWPVIPVVKHHHEKWDGTGYPDRLKGEDIPITARILSIADVYDALTSSRSYRNAWSHEQSIATIRKDSGTHFDPELVEPACTALERVVREMELEGHGPLTNTPAAPTKLSSKAAQAAKDISRVSTEFWALYEVAQTLSSSLGLSETVEILARKLEAIFPGASCAFLVLSQDETNLEVKASVGPNKEFFECASTLRSDSLSLRSLQDNKSFCGNYDHDDLLLTARTDMAWTPLESSLIVPIRYNGQALGTINLYSSEPMGFCDHDQHLLETIAERASLSLYNGILFDQSQGHALTDTLTGLYNLRFLTEHVESLCASSATDGGHFSLLCLDLDSFKPINDNFGHQKGNKVLIDVAALFRSRVKERDVVARYGGDEFVVVLPGADREQAEAIVDRLNSAIEEYDPGLVHQKLGELRLGVSIGLACYPEDGLDCASLMAAADVAMYREKSERKLEKLAATQSLKRKKSGNRKAA